MPEKHINLTMKTGHKEVIGETIAKLVLFKNGYNVYSRFLDVDAIDMIIRNTKNNKVSYNEIQIKYSKYYEKEKKYFFSIRKPSFEPRIKYYFMFICGNEDIIFMIPSLTLNNWIDKMIYAENYIKWQIYIQQKEDKWYFITQSKYENIDISKYLNNFEILK